MNKWDAVWMNAEVMSGESSYQVIKNAAIAVQAGKIAWVGKQHDLPDKPEALGAVVRSEIA